VPAGAAGALSAVSKSKALTRTALAASLARNFHRSMSENHSRSIAKAVSWRITGTIDTIVVSYVVTGRLAVAVSIGAVEVFTKIGLYYFHERVWNRIAYGRPKKGDYEI
jgi:uncharacterized membrane protein